MLGEYGIISRIICIRSSRCSSQRKIVCSVSSLKNYKKKLLRFGRQGMLLGVPNSPRMANNMIPSWSVLSVLIFGIRLLFNVTIVLFLAVKQY